MDFNTVGKLINDIIDFGFLGDDGSTIGVIYTRPGSEDEQDEEGNDDDG